MHKYFKLKLSIKRFRIYRMFVQIKQLVEEEPNSYELGEKIKQLFRTLN